MPMRDLGLLLLRIVAGMTLAAHGYPKLFGGPGKRPHPLLARPMGPNYPAAVERSGPGFAAGLQRMGVPYPEQAATLSAVAGLGGGLALLLYGTVMVFLAFDRESHSASDTLRPFIITMAPVWIVAIAGATVLLRSRAK